MQSTDDLRGVLKFSIGLLCAAAFILILIILSGGEIDDTSGKAIGTAIALAFLSLTAVAGSHLSIRQPRLAVFGYATVLISGLTFLITAVAIWTEPSDAKGVFYALIVAFACGHTSVLLASSDGRDYNGVSMVRYGTIVALWLLVVLAIAEIADHGHQVDARGMGVLAVLYALGAVVLPLLRRAASKPAAQGEIQIDHLVIGVNDRKRSDHFYSGILGATVEADPDGRVAYRIGGQRLNVHQPGATASPLAADPVRPGNSDLCFAWPGTGENAVEFLRARGIEIVEGPVMRTGAQGDGVSVYCRDPDGSLIELISYR